MKLLICEGGDRTGKDTLINQLCSLHSNIVKRHWSFPKGETNEQKTIYQKNQFGIEFSLWANLSRPDVFPDMLMLWNRSHIGELVYGTMYRDSNPTEWVLQMESIFLMDKSPEVYLVYLYADPEFVVKEDDGKSYSAKLEDKAQEIKTFHDAIDASNIMKKLKIKVNDGDKYIPQDSILQQVLQFIKS